MLKPSSAFIAPSGNGVFKLRPSQAPNDGLAELLRVLPAWVQEEAEAHAASLEEIALDLGRPLSLYYGHGYHRTERLVTKDDLHYLVHRLGGFRDDNRAGLELSLIHI